MNTDSVRRLGAAQPRRRIGAYLAARSKLAFGRSAAAFIELAFAARRSVSLVRLGTEYGGWYCSRTLLEAGGVALCCGAGEDISFDVALNAAWGLRVICVDPTPRAIAHVERFLAAAREGRAMLIEAGPESYDMGGFRAAAFDFLPCAVWSQEGVLELFAPQDPAHVSYSALNLQRTSEKIEVRASTLSAILRDFAVSQLALLKLDIEGAECKVLRSMLATGIRPLQLLVEFDQVNQPLGPLFWVELVQVIRALRAAGYELIHREHANFLFVQSLALRA